MTNEENPLDYFKNLTSDPSDHIMSLQDMEKVIKFHEEELDVEDKRVEGTDEYPNYGDDFADMVYIARRLLDHVKTQKQEIDRLTKERDEARREVEAKEKINATLTSSFDALRRERDEARWEVCGFHHLTGFLAGDYAISRGWNYFNDERKWAGFPPSVTDFKEFLKAHSDEDRKTIERLREENRQLRENKNV